MKTYTFTLPKNNDIAKEYKNKLMEKVIKAYPWLTIDSAIDYPYSDNGVEYASGGDIITLGISKTHNVSWLPKKCANCPFKCTNNNINFNIETEYDKAMKALAAYANSTINPYIEFEEEDMPIRIFDNFIQIGYEVIPTDYNTYITKFNTPSTKKIIIDIIIKVKNAGLY